MAELDPAELASVLDAADALLSNHDWDGVYNLLQPVLEANAATGADLGRLNFYLGEAAMGLNAFDAAWHYYQATLGLQIGEAADLTRVRIASLQNHYEGVDQQRTGLPARARPTWCCSTPRKRSTATTSTGPGRSSGKRGTESR